jgi:hypothetical protein
VTIMPFGKYYGRELTEIPDSYLIWLVENCNLRQPTRSGVRRELRRRGFDPTDYEEPRTEEPPPPPPRSGGLQIEVGDEELFAQIFHAGYRALALRLHPDHGGDPETMRRLNLLVEKMRHQLKE